MKRTLLFFILHLFILHSVSSAIPTGFVKIRNRRSSTALLTSNTAGTAMGDTTVASGYSQTWKIEASASGYTIRCANTGEYLQGDFDSPSGTKTILYIQNSPNASGYYNISSKSDFSGHSCLNLGNDAKTLYEYAIDSGSDWTIESVSNVTDAQVKTHLASKSGVITSTSNLAAGKYYKFISTYNLAMTGNETLATKEQDAANYYQAWTLERSGSGWLIKNAVTDKYIINQNSPSAVFPQGTVSEASTFLFGANSSDPWISKWSIYEQEYGYIYGRGMHDAQSQGHNVVCWYTGEADNASFWTIREVAVDATALAEERNKLSGFNDLAQHKDTYQVYLNLLFADKACTQLKSTYQNMTDAQLEANDYYKALPADIQAMVKKVKNNTWQTYTNGSYTAGYEKFFRVADYKAYSHHQQMATAMGMSNSYGRLSNPTGIVADAGDIIYIYVDAAPSDDCTLQVEAVPTSGVPGEHSTGSTTNLTVGLNILQTTEQTQLYIFYQLNDITKQITSIPYIKIHIEGGQLQGYWDATRGMTNADWKLLQKKLLSASNVLNLKTEHLVFAMDANIVKQTEPDEMEGLMHIWETIATNEDSYMGLEAFDGRCRNIWNCFSGATSYMHATTYGTWYLESTLPTVMSYDNMRNAGSIWGPSHEMGHNRQAAINVIGTTESSNNLFSNINTFEQGIQTSRRQPPVDVFAQLAEETPWLGRDKWNTTSMFFQLYLYFHAMHHDDQFYPKLFRKMRENPINKSAGLGAKDYLHLAKMICDVAEADLSEFFEAYGMFQPVADMYVSDYANYYVTTTQDDIDAARTYMNKYERKLGNIMFIDDHVRRRSANPNNAFLAVSPSDGYRINNLDQLVDRSVIQTDANDYSHVGDFGDYEDFTGDMDKDTEESNYTINEHYINGNPTTTITFTGSDYVGHKFYDTSGNLLWATNYREVDLPENVRALGTGNYRIVTARVVTATADNPIDKTSLITNPTFDNNNKDGWTVTCQSNNGGDRYGVAEFWASSTFDLSQTLATLPAGRWLLEMDGCFRAGADATEINTINSGQTPLNELYLYANVGSAANDIKVCQWSDTERGALLNTSENAALINQMPEIQTYSAPNVSSYSIMAANSQTCISAFFTAGRYHNALYFDVPKGGSSATIGLQLRQTCELNWCPFDNFRLTYLGLPGDVTADGQLNIDDVTLLIDIILGRADATGIQKTADVNNDGHISVADITALAAAIYKWGE